jgi:CheY-like chemotaxis protein
MLLPAAEDSLSRHNRQCRACQYHDRSEARSKSNRTPVAATSELFRILPRTNYLLQHLPGSFHSCPYEAVAAFSSKSARLCLRKITDSQALQHRCLIHPRHRSEREKITVPRSTRRLLLADDHPDLLREIQQLVATDFDVVGSAADGLTLVKMAEALKPDVVVTDIRMPGLSGIDAARIILQWKACKTVVLLTMYDNPRLIRSALEAGILGYVLKATAGEELLPAIEEGLRGRVFVSQRLRLPAVGSKDV